MFAERPELLIAITTSPSWTQSWICCEYLVVPKVVTEARQHGTVIQCEHGYCRF
jgi:hypothetical protein